MIIIYFFKISKFIVSDYQINAVFPKIKKCIFGQKPKFKKNYFFKWWWASILAIPTPTEKIFFSKFWCLTKTLLALIGNGAYGANLAKLMWTHVHICFWMAKYRKPKSFKQPFFDWIKITDFFIAKLTVFWSHFSLPKNDQFCY